MLITKDCETLRRKSVGWWRNCATSREVAGSIPDCVTEISHLHKPSGRTMALELTHRLTEMITNNIYYGGKEGRCVGLTALPPSCADRLEICEPQTPATLRACPGLCRDCLTVAFTWSKKSLQNSAEFIMRSARALKDLMVN